MVSRLVVEVAGVTLLAAFPSSASGALSSAAADGGTIAARRVAVWVQNAGANSVTPIDVVTGIAGRPVRVPFPDFGLAITPDGKTVYVTDGDHRVTAIDTATDKIRKIILVRNGPATIAMTPNGKTVYVTTSNTITPISTATNRAGNPIRVARSPDGPEALAVTPNSKTVYAINTVTVVPVNTATNRASRPIDTGGTFVGMVFTPNGATGCVLGASSVVIPIRTATNRAEKPIPVGGPGADPWAIAITPNGRTVYVANYGNSTVVPIGTATNRAGKPIKVGYEPTFIAITPNGKTAYVATVNGVYPISTATNKAGKPIRVGTFDPIAIVITPDGKTAWVSGDEWSTQGGLNVGRGFALPISTLTNTPGRLVKVGTGAANCLVTTPWRSGHAQGPSACSP